MTLSLRARLFALHALVVAVALALVSVLAIRAQRAWLITHHFDDLAHAGARAAAALPAQPAFHPGGVPALADTLGALLGVRVTLLDSSGRVLSRDELLRKVWGYNYVGETRTVDVHIRRLRQKLGEAEPMIETVTGAGYKLILPGGRAA